MLYIYFGHLENELKSPTGFYKHQCPKDWILGDKEREIIRVVDKTEVVAADCINSKWLGITGSEKLSTGVHSLLILMHTDEIINLVNMGDNCLPFLKEISLWKDITVSCTRYLNLFKDEPIVPVTMLNDGLNQLLTTEDDWFNIACDYI